MQTAGNRCGRRTAQPAARISARHAPFPSLGSNAAGDPARSGRLGRPHHSDSTAQTRHRALHGLSLRPWPRGRSPCPTGRSSLSLRQASPSEHRFRPRWRPSTTARRRLLARPEAGSTGGADGAHGHRTTRRRHVGCATGQAGPRVAGETLAAAGLPNGLRKEVLGFLPYWMLGPDQLKWMRYELVSTIAYFGVAAQADGTLATYGSGWAGWNSSALTSVINAAHSRGVRGRPDGDDDGVGWRRPAGGPARKCGGPLVARERDRRCRPRPERRRRQPRFRASGGGAARPVHVVRPATQGGAGRGGRGLVSDGLHHGRCRDVGDGVRPERACGLGRRR